MVSGFKFQVSGFKFFNFGLPTLTFNI